MERFVTPTYFIDSDTNLVLETANKIIGDSEDIREKVTRLFYWTRDKIKYDAYTLTSFKRHYKSSRIIQEKKGWCVQKAVVLASLARAVEIPARLHFADIQNHQTTEKLKNHIGTNIFLYHGYTDFFIGKKWIKATPAFNKELCDKYGLPVVEFDGLNDAILPEFTLNGEKYIDYLKDRGTAHDLPFKEIFRVFVENYPMK
jgi:transglutaminase-like putative cysteine protease